MTKISRNLRLLAPALLALSFLSVCVKSNAQALYTADKSADIFLFGGFEYAKPDYGPSTSNNTGITLGGDYTRYFGWSLAGLPIDPSLELRYTNNSGQVVKESTFMGGIRLHTSMKERYHPYIDVLFGLGTINYQPPLHYAQDHSTAYALGGGVDIDLVHHFQLKLDFQDQNQNFGQNGEQVPSGGNYTLTPMVYTLGISYHVPFRSDVGPNAHVSKPPKEEAPRRAPQPAPAAVAPAPAPADTTAPAPAPADTTAPPATAPAPTDTTTPPAGTSTPPPANQ